MTETKFTPGPWELVNGYDIQYVDEQGLAKLGQSRVKALIEAHKRAEAERDSLAAHVERLRTAWRQYEDSEFCSDDEIKAEEQLYALMEEDPATSLARLKARWQAEALTKAVAACSRIMKGQEKLAWMHQKTLPNGEEVVGEEGIPYSNKALGAIHCADEIGRMVIELRRQAEGGEA